MKIKEVTEKEAENIILTREPRGLYWTKEQEFFIAIDNLTGDAWTENFLDKKQCFDYLKESYLQCFNQN